MYSNNDVLLNKEILKKIIEQTNFNCFQKSFLKAYIDEPHNMDNFMKRFQQYMLEYVYENMRNNNYLFYNR